jgi:hypothetical protein
VTIYDTDGVTVEVADTETLLAMKVYAAQKRGRREVEDLEVLIPTVGLTTVDEVEHVVRASLEARASQADGAAAYPTRCAHSRPASSLGKLRFVSFNGPVELDLDCHDG